MARANMRKNDGSPDSDRVLEVNIPEGISSFILPLAIFISALLVSGTILYAGSKFSGSTSEPAEVTADANTEDTEEEVAGAQADTPGTVVGDFETFTEYDLDICKDDGKPVVYLFSTTWCPHCQWIKDTFDSWAKDNSDKAVAYHWEIDTMDNTLTEEVETEVPQDAMDVYNQFNPEGSIPTFVFGCRYGRVGNGYETEEDLDKERAAFDSVLDKLR